MSNRYRYGFEQRDDGLGRIYAEIPNDMFDRILSSETFKKIITNLTIGKKRAIDVKKVEDADAKRLLINDKIIAKNAARETVLGNVGSLLSVIDLVAQRADRSDPRLRVFLGKDRLADTGLPTKFTAKLPTSVDIPTIESVSRSAMVEVADKLDDDYSDFGSIELPAAHIDPELGSISVFADMSQNIGVHNGSQEQHPGITTYKLEGNNIARFSQQFVVFAGVVAMTHADDLKEAV